MKHALFIISLCLPAIAMTGCKTTVKDGPTNISIEDSSHNNSDFCPPGQAKKGSC